MKSVVIGTAGHIDHGKSALVRALTGTDPDRLKEEQERGITIDLGFAHMTVGSVTVAFVDVPGHERFVKNMLAGVGGIDGVVLVVAADESIMPQTREHFEICRLLAVRSGIVVLTKSDLVDEDTLDLVRLEVKDLVQDSFLQSAPVIPVSSKTGAGLSDLRDALATLGASAAGKPVDGPARLPIDRVFSMKGFGTVVTGTLVSGTLEADSEAVRLPDERRVKLRGLQVHGSKLAKAVAGQRVALNLGGIDVGEITRGDSLVAPGAFESTRSLDGVIETLSGTRALRHGARVRFHQGTSELLGRVAIAGAVSASVDSGGSLNLSPAAVPPAGTAAVAEIKPGSRAYVRVRLESAAVLTRGDRFVLRAYSPPVTIAGGLVLDPHPPRAGVRTVAGRRRFERLSVEGEDGTVAALRVMLEESGPAGLASGALMTRAGLAPTRVPDVIRELLRQQDAVEAGDVLIAVSAFDTLRERLLASLKDYHRTQPLSEGMPREEARERVFTRSTPAIFDSAIADLTARGVIAGRDRLALATHRVALSEEELAASATIERIFREAGLKPPEPASVASGASIPNPLFERVITLLVRQRVLVKVDTLLFHQAALAGLKSDIAGLKENATQKPAVIDVAAFKQRYGVTRKFAIPLLEYLDRERVTRRVGDKRMVT